MAAEDGPGGCPFPPDRLYDVEADVWLQIAPDGRRAILGLTAPIVSFAGRFQRVEFRSVEGRIDAGRSIATVESVRYTGAVRLPRAATVLRWNERLRSRAKLLNDAPYDQGWVAELELADAVTGSPRLVDAATARRSYAPKVAELRIHCLPAAPDAEMFEIGAECSAILARLDEVLAQQAPGDVVLLVTDDATAPIEMVRWSDRTGHTVLHVERDGNLVKVLVRREADPHPRRR